ncbi:acetyl-CoA hydrolase/transferase family protein [Syntrophomonas wolfei]|jgi:4-hydroxybutyrate CoA-transferase|nr:acetyl-CoA hydrolase/transferase C-terminal domain-containing protein [Syntrophomonas wolfei]
MALEKWKQEYNKKLVSHEEAAKLVKSGDVVASPLGTGSCSGQMFDAILDRHEELQDVIISDSIQIYPSKLYDPKFMASIEGRITHMPIFGIATIRKMYAAQLSDFCPATTMDAGDKYAERADVFALMVSAPNKHGYVNLGPTCFYTLDSVRGGRKKGHLRTVIAEVNDQMPIIFGDNWMHISEFDYIIERSAPIPAFKRGQATEVEQSIGNYVLELINDGDTVQMGLGGISEAVAAGLKGRHDLGILTEMLPLALPQLVEDGIVNNSRKPIYKGISIASFVLGDQALYDYISENPSCQLYPGSYTNDPRFIAQHPNMIAMNTSLMIDFSGHSSCEGVGHTMVSGVGGQLDFLIGAYWSEGGKGINMLSAARKMPDGSLASNIVPELPLGTPVSVPRTFTNYVITEFGIAQLRYKSRRERALELISIAHPDLRGELRDSLKTRFYPKPS